MPFDHQILIARIAELVDMYNLDPEWPEVKATMAAVTAVRNGDDTDGDKRLAKTVEALSPYSNTRWDPDKYGYLISKEGTLFVWRAVGWLLEQSRHFDHPVVTEIVITPKLMSIYGTPTHNSQASQRLLTLECATCEPGDSDESTLNRLLARETVAKLTGVSVHPDEIVGAARCIFTLQDDKSWSVIIDKRTKALSLVAN